MTIQTSDLVKAVGYLAIYWGYLELELDERVKAASPIVPMPIDKKSGAAITTDIFLERPFRNRVDYLKKHLLDRFDRTRACRGLARDRTMIDKTLSRCATFSDLRNEYMHSVIYSKEGVGTFLQERKTRATTRINAQEVCNLANAVFRLGDAATNLWQFIAPRLVQAPLK
jgi:hypothetical protein